MHVTPPRFHIARPFNWGVVFVRDLETQDIPGGPETTTDLISATPSAIAMAVRHAQDTDDVEDLATVSITVFVDDQPEGVSADFTGEIDLASGVLTIGDADTEEALELEVGRWTISIVAVPAEHPDDVTIWLSRQNAEDALGAQ